MKKVTNLVHRERERERGGMCGSNEIQREWRNEKMHRYAQMEREKCVKKNDNNDKKKDVLNSSILAEQRLQN